MKGGDYDERGCDPARDYNERGIQDRGDTMKEGHTSLT